MACIPYHIALVFEQGGVLIFAKLLIETRTLGGWVGTQRNRCRKYTVGAQLWLPVCGKWEPGAREWEEREEGGSSRH